MSRVPENLRWGIRSALHYSVFYSTWGTIGYLLGASLFLKKYGVSGWYLVVFYFLGPLLVGALVGLLRPLTTSTWGRMVTGFLVALPVSLLTLLIFIPRDSLNDTIWKVTVLISLTIGPSAALILGGRNK